MGARVGEKLRDYEIVGVLGRGGMATVFEARHVELGHRVAIKVMHAELSSDPASADRFLRGARNAARIQHPHVARVYDVGTNMGVPFLVMEIVGRETLATHVHREGPVALDTLIDVFLPILSAVAAAHTLGIVHRDLKPANVALAVDRNGTLRPALLDFGTSRSRDIEETDVEATCSDAVLGTIPYMSPEQVHAAKNVDERTDQYALGVMMYECATGSRPFAGDTRSEIMNAIVTGRLDPPSRRRASLPPQFDSIVLRAMHCDPAARFGSVKALGGALLRLAGPKACALWLDEFKDEDETGSSGPPAPVRLPTVRRRRRFGWVAAAIGGTAVLAGVTAIGVGRRGVLSSDAPPPPLSPLEPSRVLSPVPSFETIGSDPAVARDTPVAPAPRARGPLVSTSSSHIAPGPSSSAASSPPPRLGTNLAPVLE